MRSAILVLCVGAAAAASAPAAPTTSYGSCEKKSAYDDGACRRKSRPKFRDNRRDSKLTLAPAGHAKDDSHAADDGHTGHRLLASAPPSDDDAPIKCMRTLCCASRRSWTTTTTM